MGLRYMIDGVYNFSKIDCEVYKEDLIELIQVFDNEYFHGLQFPHTAKKDFPPIDSLGISFVYFHNNAIVGYIRYSDSLACCDTFKSKYISQVYVKKEVRNLGIGKKMMSYAIDCFQTENCDFVRIDANRKFGATLKSEFGFECLGKVLFMMIKHKMTYLGHYVLDVRKSKI